MSTCEKVALGFAVAPTTIFTPNTVEARATTIVASGSELPPLRILVAEDNPMNQELMQCLLEKRGHVVTIASNGREAIAEAQQKHFDIILMDVQMPEMDGLEATRAIRAEEVARGKQALPIIALTASAMPKDRGLCMAAGMTDFVPKPARPKVLLEVIARCLVLDAQPQQEPAAAVAGGGA